MVRSSTLLALGALTAAAVACAPASETTTQASPAAPGASGSADTCAKDSLTLKTPGKLTVGTDKPAYEPWFKDDNPANGEGFESAVVYAVAGRLGFAPGDVTWATVKFDSAFAPGAKQFDFDLNQVSVTPDRAKVVDFSKGYYTVKQAVVALEGSNIASATDLAGLKDAKIGVQVGTTSLQAVKDVIKPPAGPNVYNEQIDAVNALKNKQVDAIVVDLPTAFYVTAAQIENAKIVGQFGTASGEPEVFGAVFEKGSPLVGCVNKALDELTASGELAKIESKWLGSAAGAPELK
ncbi:polar amino acid transport system substrate-binding protein [Streptosporangium becharense]|uniref:Polar amino acid transport system substrate-binding protein n=1 Tax=Streptosporangium becharense TaxID=1816182 RepID=A0A7W9IGW5_9ACTN|nr:ABC transporter substrate-binding protein [Streptosporangium becharense]MBB2912698.1 polar amino acid transport system substrate-binding protein [Streptosporangium becharense]MBB5820473.1 polar amino acid transport system substrate-binding protein [Streptosporangium becharense]